MKRLLKWILGLLPFIVLGVIISVNYYQSSRIFSAMQDADGLVMGTADTRFIVRVRRSIKNEVTTDVITVADRDGKVVQRNSISMDHDLYGLGFVKAMQADDDPDLEVVGWGNNLREGEPFILDFADGTIIRRPIGALSGTAQGLVDAYKTNTLQSYGLTVFTILATPVYYVLYLIIFLIMKLTTMKKQPRVESS